VRFEESEEEVAKQEQAILDQQMLIEALKEAMRRKNTQFEMKFQKAVEVLRQRALAKRLKPKNETS